MILLSEAPPHSTTQLLHMRLSCRRPCSTCVGCFKCPLDRTLDATNDCVSTREEDHKQHQQHAKQMSQQRSQHTVGIARKKLREESEVHRRPSLHAWFSKAWVFHVRSHASAGVCVHGGLRGTGTCDVDVCSCVCGMYV